MLGSVLRGRQLRHLLDGATRERRNFRRPAPRLAGWLSRTCLNGRVARLRGSDRAPRSRLTIRDIAELAGVSIATVSRAVNGRGDVSEETRAMVRRIAREHGYRA